MSAANIFGKSYQVIILFMCKRDCLVLFNFIYEKLVGFGMTSDEPGSGTSIYLKYVNMTVISTFSCQIFWSQFVNDNNICTNTLSGTSTCAGDNGGPLVATTDDERLILVGVGSFRSGGGCTQGHPGFILIFINLTLILISINFSSCLHTRYSIP